MRSDIVSRVKIHIIKANIKVKHILDELNPCVRMWTSDQREGYSTSTLMDRYNPYWDEEFDFTLTRGDKKIKMWIVSQHLYPKSKFITSVMEIPIGQIGDHIDYDGPVYNDDKEEVGTFSYEIDFLPLEYSAEIEDKYRREMEKIEKEEEKQKEEKREEEERRRKEEEERRRKEEEQKKKKEEEQTPQRKMVSMPYRKIRRPKAGQDERDWEWARKYYES